MITKSHGEPALQFDVLEGKPKHRKQKIFSRLERVKERQRRDLTWLNISTTGIWQYGGRARAGQTSSDELLRIMCGFSFFWALVLIFCARIFKLQTGLATSQRLWISWLHSMGTWTHLGGWASWQWQRWHMWCDLYSWDWFFKPLIVVKSTVLIIFHIYDG